MFDTEGWNRMVERPPRQERMIHRLIHDLPGCAHCSCETWSIALPAPAVRARWAKAYFDRRVHGAYPGHLRHTKARKESA